MQTTTVLPKYSMTNWPNQSDNHISKETDHNVCKKNKQEYFHTQLFYKINDLSAEAVINVLKKDNEMVVIKEDSFF